MSETVKPEWCPSMSGKMPAYLAQYLTADAEWKDVPTQRLPNGSCGAGFPKNGGLLMDHIGLQGYAQAQAIAWSFAAEHEAVTGKTIHTRVLEYELVYDLKARIAPPKSASKEAPPHG